MSIVSKDIKVVLLGDSCKIYYIIYKDKFFFLRNIFFLFFKLKLAVGKSKIAIRFVKNYFDENQNANVGGASFFSKMK
jgi:hypothetical protein